jgi:hypothetical protein
MPESAEGPLSSGLEALVLSSVRTQDDTNPMETAPTRRRQSSHPSPMVEKGLANVSARSSMACQNGAVPGEAFQSKNTGVSG